MPGKRAQDTIITVSMGRTAYLRYSNRLFSKAATQVNTIVDEAQVCGNRIINAMSYLLLLLAAGVCTIPVIPACKKWFREAYSEDELSNNTLLVFFAGCIFSALAIQALKKCRKQVVVLDNDQDERLMEIKKELRLPVTITPDLPLDFTAVLNAIGQSKINLKRLEQILGLIGTDSRVYDAIFDYLNEPHIESESSGVRLIK